MKYIFLLTTMISLGFSNIFEIDSFNADFEQIITNDAKNELKYSGHVSAIKPNSALWLYTKPTKKQIYISDNKATIVEPDIEQVIIKHLNNSFNFFNMLKSAKKISDDVYLAKFQNIEYKIKIHKKSIESISYQDELENSVVITFINQTQNTKIDAKIFTPIIPADFDVIED